MTEMTKMTSLATAAHAAPAGPAAHAKAAAPRAPADASHSSVGRAAHPSGSTSILRGSLGRGQPSGPPPAASRETFQQLARQVRGRRLKRSPAAAMASSAAVPRAASAARPRVSGSAGEAPPRLVELPPAGGAAPARIHTGPVVVARQSPEPAAASPQPARLSAALSQAAARAPRIPTMGRGPKALAAEAAASEPVAAHSGGPRPTSRANLVLVNGTAAPSRAAPHSQAVLPPVEGAPPPAVGGRAAAGRLMPSNGPTPGPRAAPPPESLPPAGWRVSGLVWRAPAGRGQAVQFRISPPGTRLSAVLVRMAATDAGARVVLSVRSVAWLKSLAAGKAGLASQLEAPLGATGVEVTSGAGFGFGASTDPFREPPAAPYSGVPPGAGSTPAFDGNAPGLDLRA